MCVLNIRENIQNMDYSFTNPLTYLVFVPGLSLIIQKIHFDKLLPLPPLNFGKKATQATLEQTKEKHNRFENICK